ncbi:MAG TPA: DUF349 domain-containing protein, partial [Paludibacter sp.]|nr:DUF349 domain-containing protein [Paludibacter sp.]
MSPLELNKDPEIAPSETIESIETIEIKNIIEVAEKTEVKAEIIEAVTEVVPETSLEAVVEKQPEEVQSITPDYAAFTKPELVETLKALINKEVDAVKDEVEIIKQLFYKKAKAEVEELKKTFIENGGEEIEFLAPKDELEETFKSLLNEFRTKKATLTAQLEKEKENNLLQKQHLLGQMKVLVDSNDDVSTHINEFRSLQQKWKSIGQVPASASTELWKQYNLYQESFWDLIKINNELREYDFKKNLESKTLLCEAAEKLASETDVVSAFQQLQKLHEE